MKKNIELIELAIKILEFIKEQDDLDLQLLLNDEKKLSLMDLVVGEENNGIEDIGSREVGSQSREESELDERRSLAKKSECKSIEEKEKNTKKTKRRVSTKNEEVEEVNEFDIYIRELSKFRSKEEGCKYLLDNKLTVTKLKILAKKLSVYIKSKSKKEDIVESIIEGIVGSRLKLESLRKY
ncbi:MAG: hypothetical protein ACRCWM_06280 [Sarcina sp.]